MAEAATEPKPNAPDDGIGSADIRKKDGWDKFSAITSALIPLSIAFSGLVFSISMENTKIEIEKARMERDHAIALINARVEQARLLSELIRPLLSHEETERKAANLALLHALPELGPKLVSLMSVQDKSKFVREFAKDSLKYRRKTLVEQLFSSDKAERVAATTELVSGWRQDKGLVPMMLQYASNNIRQVSGVINTLIVLDNLDRSLLAENRTAILTFLERADLNGQQTRQLIEKVKDRFKSSPVDVVPTSPIPSAR